MDRGAWWATVHRVAKSRTQLSDRVCTHAVTDVSTLCSRTRKKKSKKGLKGKIQALILAGNKSNYSPNDCPIVSTDYHYHSYAQMFMFMTHLAL